MIRAIIVDDEQPSVNKLEKLLNDSGVVEIKGKFTEPRHALQFLHNNKVDAAFLDIEMPEIDGIELSNQIVDLQGRIAVVFVTAYNEYAVEAFRINALDFLMKPVTAERLKETLNRIVEEKGILVNSPELNVQCFGKFRVSAGTAEIKFRTEKAEELLAFLIDRRSSFVGRSEIIDALWEDYEGDRALIHFNTTLHYVKKALLQYGISVPIEFNRGSYRLETKDLRCDYLMFHTFFDNIKTTGLKSAQHYEAAAELYKGDYLSGKEYEWAETRRQLMRERYIQLLITLADYYRAAGDNSKAVEWLKKGLAYEPLHRGLNYSLIETMLIEKDRISAVRHYDIYRNGLRKKLRQEPDEALRKLFE